MKEFKGTKGPWQILKDDGELKIIQKGSIEKGPGWRSYSPVCEEVSSKKNANLIAAAPDLLELLIWLVDIEGPQPGHSEWASRVNDVIAKALGESK